MPAKAGDVVFFGGHILHRSKRNFTTDRFRRAFVGHYCNARSFTQWGADTPIRRPARRASVDPVTKMTNGSHILARGDTHLPFACPASARPARRCCRRRSGARRASSPPAMMGDMDSGMMGAMAADPEAVHDVGED